MKISWKWLKEYIDIPCSLNEIADRLTMSGLEVEDIILFRDNIPREVVTAQITSLKKHPDSDNLQIVEVNIGSETVSVVSGAPGLEKGKRVAFAPHGVKLPAGKVEKRKIRGIVSSGLLCCDADFDLTEQSEGIIYFPEDCEIGEYAGKYIETEEAVIELGVTPNRPDCLNVMGIAREVSALTGNGIKQQKSKFNEIKTPSSHLISLVIDAPDLCPAYTARVIEDVEIKTSPVWIQKRLRASGIRAINNVVDITNYVLIETGHPLHAFDYDLIEGKKIIVRKARKGEKITTLDSEERTLTDDMLLIADEKNGIAVAGVMGGKDSEVTEKTTKLVIESAYFTAAGIRKTSKKLGLSTEASFRFERGSDPGILFYASDRVSALVSQIANGKVCKGMVSESFLRNQPPLIPLRKNVMKKVLGTEISMEKAANICENLGMTIKSRDEEGVSINPPSYRGDIKKEIDLVEEVARISGYENIPVKYPVSQAGDNGNLPGRLKTISNMRSELVRIGFSEVINYSFVDSKVLAKISDKTPNAVSICNPLSEEQDIMRTSLIQGILNSLSFNVKRYLPDLKIFEIGRVYLPVKDKFTADERVFLTGLVSGNISHPSWYEKERKSDFFDIKGVLESLCDVSGLKLNLKSISVEKVFLDSSESADIFINDKKCGYVGKISDIIVDDFELKTPVYVFEIDIDSIDFKKTVVTSFKRLSKIPPSYRDLAIIVNDSFSAEEILNCVKKSSGEILEDVVLFDIYKGKPVRTGFKSVALSLTFRGIESTLTDEEINTVTGSILESLKKELSAEIRN